MCTTCVILGTLALLASLALEQLLALSAFGLRYQRRTKAVPVGRANLGESLDVSGKHSLVMSRCLVASWVEDIRALRQAGVLLGGAAERLFSLCPSACP